MMPVYISFGVLFVWLAALTFLLMRTMGHYKKLTANTHAETLESMLNTILDKSTAHSKDIEVIQKAVNQLDTDRHSYLQKFGYVKFNALNDRVGGDQSFVIALLDNHGNGYVKTFMYMRDGVRVYVKPVKGGKSEEYELSQEEKDAIAQAS